MGRPTPGLEADSSYHPFSPPLSSPFLSRFSSPQWRAWPCPHEDPASSFSLPSEIKQTRLGLGESVGPHFSRPFPLYLALSPRAPLLPLTDISRFDQTWSISYVCLASSKVLLSFQGAVLWIFKLHRAFLQHNQITVTFSCNKNWKSFIFHTLSCIFNSFLLKRRYYIFSSHIVPIYNTIK